MKPARDGLLGKVYAEESNKDTSVTIEIIASVIQYPLTIVNGKACASLSRSLKAAALAHFRPATAMVALVKLSVIASTYFALPNSCYPPIAA